MRILQVISSLRVGGAEKIVKDLTIALNNRGNEVAVAVFDGTDSPLKRELIDSGCKVQEFAKRGNVYSVFNIIRLLRLIRSYDIVHTHNTSPQFCAAVCSLFIKKVFITTEHSTFNRRRNNPIWFLFDKWMYSRYDKIVCVSDSVRNNLVNYLGGNLIIEKIDTVYNGVDVVHFHETEGYDRLSLCPESANKFVVCMVAGFRKEKDQDTVIRAFSILPKDRFELWLVGDGERRKDLEELMKSLDLSSNVVFWGIRSDVAEILHTADAIVMSSHYEGLSLSSLEGMAVGKPFIASDVDGLRGIVENAGLLFSHMDYRELADIIYEVFTDINYAHLIAEKCLERASSFDISKMVDQYIRLYTDVLYR